MSLKVVKAIFQENPIFSIPIYLYSADSASLLHFYSYFIFLYIIDNRYNR